MPLKTPLAFLLLLLILLLSAANIQLYWWQSERLDRLSQSTSNLLEACRGEHAPRYDGTVSGTKADCLILHRQAENHADVMEVLVEIRGLIHFLGESLPPIATPSDPVDLSEVITKLDEIKASIEELDINSVPTPPIVAPNDPIDLSGIEAELRRLANLVDGDLDEFFTIGVDDSNYIDEQLTTISNDIERIKERLDIE